MLAVAVLLSALPTLPADAQAQDLGDELRPLLTKFQIEAVRADYVIAVDTSLSMRPLFADVRRAMESFISALDAGDQLSLIAFDTLPRLLMARSVPADRSEILGLLPAGPHPDGRFTDIGAAVKMVIEQLDRPGASTLQFVLFITDGLHDPPPGSAFGRGAAAAWTNLRAGGTALAARRALRVYGIGLKQRTDIALLRGVFPDAGLLTLGARDLAAYFRQIKLAVQVEKLKVAVGQELQTGRLVLVAADGSWGKVKPGGEVRRRFRLRSEYRRLSVAIRMTSPSVLLATPVSPADGAAPSGVALDPAPFSQTIAPGSESAPFVVTLRLPPSRVRFHLQRSRDVPGRLAFETEASLEHAAALKRLGFEPAVDLRFRDVPVQYVFVSGLSWPAAGALGGLVLLAAVLILVTVQAAVARARPPTLPGRLLFLRAPDAVLPEAVDLGEFRGQATIGAVGDIRLAAGGPEQILSILDARREDDGESLFLTPKVSGMQISGAPVLPGTSYRLAPGATIEVGGYVMQWLA